MVYIPKRISVISSHSIVVTFDTADGDVPQFVVPRQADNPPHRSFTRGFISKINPK